MVALLLPFAMNIRLRQMRCNGGNCGGLTLLSPSYLYWLIMNKKQSDNSRKISSVGLYWWLFVCVLGPSTFFSFL